MDANGRKTSRRPLLRLLHREETVSEDNIMAMVEEGEESGAIQSNEKELIDQLRCRNGNLEIMLSMQESAPAEL